MTRTRRSDSAERAEKRATQVRKDCRRVDLGELAKPQRLENGWLKAEAHLTRTGVFEYLNPDGSVRRELRLPEDVFHSDSLASFSMLPLTDEHPPEFLTADNTREYQRGHIGERVVPDGARLRSALLVTDGALVSKMERGDATQVSCGYVCDLEEVTGVTAEGEPYDGIQRNIRGNHVAIVPAGRAGPEVRVRMDSAASRMLSGSNHREAAVEKIRIDGVEYAAGSAEAVSAMRRWQEKLDASAKELAEKQREKQDAAAKDLSEKLKAAESEAEKAKARADAAAEKAQKLDAELKAAPAKIASEIKARMALESEARAVLGKKVKLDSLSAREVKLAVLAELVPKFDAKGKSDDYVDARYDSAIEDAAEEEEDSRADATEDEPGRVDRRFVTDGDGDMTEGEEEESEDGAALEAPKKEDFKPHKDSAEAYAAMLRRNRFMWQQPIDPHAKKQ